MTNSADELSDYIAAVLGENKEKPKQTIRQIVKHFGPDYAKTILKIAQEKHAAGGLMTLQGDRPRTLGGIFFYLARQLASTPEQINIFPSLKKQLKHEPVISHQHQSKLSVLSDKKLPKGKRAKSKLKKATKTSDVPQETLTIFAKPDSLPKHTTKNKSFLNSSPLAESPFIHSAKPKKIKTVTDKPPRPYHLKDKYPPQYEKLLLELEDLETVRRPQLVEIYRNAAQNGQVSHNPEYQDAQERLELIDERIKHIEDILGKSRQTFKKSKPGIIGVGSQFTVEWENKELETFVLVEAIGDSLLVGSISTQSPMGKVVVGKKVGDKGKLVTKSGRLHFKIKHIEG